MHFSSLFFKDTNALLPAKVKLAGSEGFQREAMEIWNFLHLSVSVLNMCLLDMISHSVHLVVHVILQNMLGILLIYVVIYTINQYSIKGEHGL